MGGGGEYRIKQRDSLNHSVPIQKLKIKRTTAEKAIFKNREGWEGEKLCKRRKEKEGMALPLNIGEGWNPKTVDPYCHGYRAEKYKSTLNKEAEAE